VKAVGQHDRDDRRDSGDDPRPRAPAQREGVEGNGRGDHRLLVNVAMPRRLSDKLRGLLEQFAQAADEDTYSSDEGFFDKLKSAFR